MRHLDPSGSALIDAFDIDSNSKGVIERFDLDQTNFNCNSIGANAVKLTTTDVNGNTDTCSAVVDIADTVEPDALCQDVTIALNETRLAVVSASDVSESVLVSPTLCKPLAYYPSLILAISPLSFHARLIMDHQTLVVFQA